METKRTYAQYLYLGQAPGAAHIYDWTVWRQIMPLLEPIVRATKERMAVRSSQFDRTTEKAIAFGRLGWDEKSQQAWTHGSPRTAAICATWEFQFTQLWAPSWAKVPAGAQGPDLFIEVHKEHARPDQRFDQGLLLGLAEETITPELAAHLAAIVPRLKEHLQCVLAARRVAPWLEPYRLYTSLSLSLQDFFTNGLHELRKAHGALTVDTIMGDWQRM
jgi:hypothetical protein